MKVLLVIDMLNDFLLPSGPLYCGDKAQAIVPLVKRTLQAFRKEGAPIFFVADAHRKDDVEFDRFPPHCIKGTSGASLLAGLYAEGEPIIEKTRYSAFYNTDLEEQLEALSQTSGEPLEVHVVGVCTHICVYFTVEELRNRDIKTIVYRDGVASFDDVAHDFCLTQMESVLGAEIL